jgi:GWxTD domain-containing protein
MRIAKLLVFAAAAIAGSPLWAGDTLSLAVDCAAFRNPENGTAYVEVYCGLLGRQLTFLGTDTSQYLYAGVFLEAAATDADGKTVDSAQTYFLSQTKDTSQNRLGAMGLYDFVVLHLSPGSYTVGVTAIDDVSKKTGHASASVLVPEFGAVGLESSDLELAYEIRNIDEAGIGAVNQRLVKEGWLVIPNPTGRYRWGRDSLLMVYSELYGLDTTAGPSGSFAVGYRVKDSLGNDVADFGGARYDKPGQSAVLTKSLNISALNPGNYHLILEAIDQNSPGHALKTKAFAVVNVEPHGPEAATPEMDAQLMTNIAWYFFSEAEKSRVKELTPEGKKNFIRQFWRGLDDDPTTPENPVYDDAVRRYVYVNENYSLNSDRTDGWKTDRGRVLIMYGFPDGESEVELPGAGYPMVKWEYHKIEGGVVFIFVNDEKAGAKDFRLVHSTHPREISDPSWMQKYRNAAPEDDWQRGEE